MFWEEKIETIDGDGLKALQLGRLRETFAKCSDSAFYAEVFKKNGIRGIGSFSDLERVPFTTKNDLRNGFPAGFLCFPMEQVVRLHSSSGTTGNPTVIYHTKNDIEDWTDLLARCMTMAGVTKNDVFQNMMGYGLFTGGLGFHYGAERVGCLTIPFGPGNSRRQLWFMKAFGTTVVHVLPSYALHLHTFLGEECGRQDLCLRTAFIGAEPHTEEMRRSIERIWGIKAYNSYGLSEMCGPGVAFECPEQNGMHIWEDRFYVEIVDPKTGAILPEGEPGELVLTTLRREANPLIRYRTRDLTRIIPGPCPCGRTHRRIDRISGRSDDMLIINGVNIFPMQIERTIMKFPGVGTNYLVEIVKENYMDRICVSVEVGPGIFSGSLEGLMRLKDTIASSLKSELGVSAVVRLVEPNSLPVSEGKAKRILDKR
jgi:phenylacetate-CoA ligase